MEKHVLHETTEGTPQGGIISAALANCALDGLERVLREKYPSRTRLKSLGDKLPSLNFIRYADDFIITSKSKELLEREIKPLVEQFLRERGLELSPSRHARSDVDGYSHRELLSSGRYVVGINLPGEPTWKPSGCAGTPGACSVPKASLYYPNMRNRADAGD
jgi:hypothetical protein